MTPLQTGSKVTVPEVLTEEHHEAIRTSWELPAYERQTPPTARSTKPLVVGILAAAVSLAIGFGAGYWAHSQMVETAAPLVISRVDGPVDANGAPLGRRVAPFATQSPNELPTRVATDTNGTTLGRRVPPFDDTATPPAQVAEADTVAFGRHGGRP